MHARKAAAPFAAGKGAAASARLGAVMSSVFWFARGAAIGRRRTSQVSASGRPGK